MNKTWKHTERTIAKRLNGVRVGVTGRATADVLSERFAVEVKHRKALPDWLKTALAQAEAGSGGRMPVVVLHEAGQRHDGDFVILRLKDFEELSDGFHEQSD